MKPFAHGGARALVLLHDRHLRAFFTTWREARSVSLVLPVDPNDPAYASLGALLHHVLGSAGGYMRWMCEMLELPDPLIDAAPGPASIKAVAKDVLEHVLTRWRDPLREVSPERFEDRPYTSRWGTPYCIDAMLEHAVMHPIRHAYQLERWMRDREVGPRGSHLQGPDAAHRAAHPPGR